MPSAAASFSVVANAPKEARQAGLRWVSDSDTGLQRHTQRGKFVFRDAKGRTLRDAAVLARIHQLAIPPAWQDVWICADAEGHLQATGRDARGRKQYRYHADWHRARGETKFGNLQAFGQALPRIRASVKRALTSSGGPPTRPQVLATLVRLLDTTWLRIGNEAYARNNHSYGLTTLRTRHAGVQGDALKLSFVGKSGVRHDVQLTDSRVARTVRRCRELPGQELFQYLDADGTARRIDSGDVNAWLTEVAGLRITAKDFRTWHGSVFALDLMQQACAPGAGPWTPQQVITMVAKRLGNTPAVCRKAYIHPRVLDLLNKSLGDEALRGQVASLRRFSHPISKRGLTLPEQRLLSFLAST